MPGDHDPDPRLDEALDLGRGPLDRAARLGVRVEEVARDENEVDLLCEGQVHGGHERRELPLALGGGPFTEVRVPRPEVHVRRVEQSQHDL